MQQQFSLKSRFTQPSLNMTSFYKIIGGRKYHCNGTVPKVLEEDLRRTFQRHGLVLEVEPDDYDKEMIKLWSRRR